MSATVSLRTSLLFDAVRACEHLQRMDGPLVRTLVDREVGELAIARDQLLFRVDHPASTAGMSASTLRCAASRKRSGSPASSHGIPQQTCPGGRSQAKPLRSSTPTIALPISGAWYSTRHVGNNATRPRAGFATA